MKRKNTTTNITDTDDSRAYKTEFFPKNRRKMLDSGIGNRYNISR